METRKVIIIGTGPAGLTAAIYTGRADLKPLVLEGHEPGGQLTLTTEVENFPGFEHGVMGPELMASMKKQAARFGAEFQSLMCTDVDFSKRPFTVTASNGQTYLAETVIISTGASAKWLGLPNEKELTGRGVSTCATCDGFFYRDRIVHVVGGGDTAMEDATFITKFAKKVYIVHRKDTLRASKAMQERAMNNPKIEFLWDTVVSEIKSGPAGVSSIVVENLKTGDKHERETDGLFYAIGHNPNTAFLKGQITLDDHGFIKTQNGPETNIPGVFACGDVQDSYYRQAITAAGSGCQAAIKAERFLEGH
ncbi:thioredoxin-disulfide reductase [Peredibacter starrii]|uniref:Thioredoxin reductase n=1 Tax=Peredibacter starrii TaxID=28202 RepID=A0AAX4HIT5_9BACT|nr:thioredoxin-disulfide reductase [Peredibacter starrii]WPU63150.1 thioredoxin-disulfide reductase [Peredibacter starrii]